jgi:hypothetical protein
VATDPRTTARYPVSTDVPNVAQFIQNAVNDLSDTVVPRFTSSAARDAAHSAWVAAGNTMDNGLLCTVSGDPQVYRGSWQPTLPVKYRRVVPTASGSLNGTVLYAANQTVQSLFGTSVNYMVDIDVNIKLTIPSGIGATLEVLVDGVVQDGDEYSNGGTTSAQYTLRARSGATFADNTSHTINARITSLTGAITVFTTYGRMLMLARPYLAF